MALYKFMPELDNLWLNKYNRLIELVEQGKLSFGNQKLTLHHIIPRSVAPNLIRDRSNRIWLPFKEHMDMHYWLWRFDPKFARQLWFGCVYGRKHGLWDLPGGDEEYEQLKHDLSLTK